MRTARLYFPGFNGLRAIAALIVMIFHTDQWCAYFGLQPYGFWNTRMQTYAVVLFFVLSGFLITYLLLQEKERSGRIAYRKFYLRRILRIWPVYYLVLLAGVLLLVFCNASIERGLNHNLPLTVALYGTLLANIGFYLGLAPDLIGVLWSVGAEEQFYAFWPFLLDKAKNVFRSLVFFLGGYLAVKVAAGLGLFSFLPFDLGSLLFFLPFDHMAIGAVAAWLYFKRFKVLWLAYLPLVQVAAWLFLLVSIFWHPVELPFIQGLNKTIHAVVYAVLIVNVGTNPKTLLTLENRLFAFLGRISYGIYAYHFLILFLLSLFFQKQLVKLPATLGHGIVFACEITTTIVFAYLSHRYFESWFLKKKDQYTVVNSGPAREAELFVLTETEAHRAV